MNIAFLLKKFGGDEVDAAISTILNLAKEIEKKGHKIYIITERGYVKNKKTGKWSRTSKYDKIRGLDVYRPYAFPQIRSKSIFNLPYVLERLIAPSMGVRKIENEFGIKFDVIHSFGAAHFSVLTGYFGKKFSHNKNVRLIYTIKSYSLYDKHFLQPGNNFWARILNLADNITVPTITMKNKLIESNVKENKIKIIYSYINLEKFYPDSKATLRKKYGFSKDKKILLYYGQWGVQKGVHDLIKISPQLAKKINNLVVLLVCPNKLKKKNREYYNEYKKKGNLKLVEGVVNINEYLNLSDLVVLPYKTIKGTETNPLCIIEALSTRTPVISVDFLDIEELFSDSIIIAKNNNSEDLIAKIEAYFSNPKTHNKKLEVGYSKRKLFDISKISKDFIKIYNSTK